MENCVKDLNWRISGTWTKEAASSKYFLSIALRKKGKFKGEKRLSNELQLLFRKYWWWESWKANLVKSKKTVVFLNRWILKQKFKCPTFGMQIHGCNFRGYKFYIVFRLCSSAPQMPGWEIQRYQIRVSF